MKFTTRQQEDLSGEADKYNLKDFPECRYKIHSQSWFLECFKNNPLPKGVRAVSIKFCVKYDVKGICDPAYIGNVIKHNLKMSFEKGTLQSITNRLSFCYRTNILKVSSLSVARKYIYSLIYEVKN